MLSEAHIRKINIGAIINDDTRTGKELKASMIVATKMFNNSSENLKISLQFRNPGANPLEAAYAAEELITKNDAKVIIGMETWEQTALVADVASQFQVPIISFATSPTTQPSLLKKWPSLIQMGGNINQQIRCIASIVGSFEWRKVIAIYEADHSYGGDSGIFPTLYEALQNISVEIEHHIALPPFSSLSDPRAFLSDSLANILSKQSRVFIVHLSSSSYADHLFTEAKQLRLIEKDSAWIVTESVASQLDFFSSSVKEKMYGSLGIKTDISEENSPSFAAFKHAFQEVIKSHYGDKESSKPGIFALWAYDGITAITNAIKSKNNGTNISSTMLAKTILSSNFTGLSGHVSFQEGKISQIQTFQIINVNGSGYKKLRFWSFDEYGFFKSINKDVLNIKISWPGNLNRVPKGWSMPSAAKPMKIGIPGRTSFEKFVNVTGNNYSGFCIDIFKEVLKIVEQKYELPYRFEPFNGTYDELVHSVANKTYDAVVGDVTILAQRSKEVEFTQPFATSGLVIVVTKKSNEGNDSWTFLKPFTKEMWAVTAAILFYTVMIVWLLERQSNPEFQGPLWNQITTALWFMFSSIFFAHRERIINNNTRVAVFVWLFVVFVLTSSYTANLSTMFTIQSLEPNVTDIEFLKKTNAMVGCDGDSFVLKYLQDVFRFKLSNIKMINSEYAYPEELKNGSISAAFLELPYGKAFLDQYCEGFTLATKTTTYGGDRFGGLGFVFQKGSPIAADVSEAILTLTENGTLKQLEKYHFHPSKCRSKTPNEVESLDDVQAFLGLFLFSIGTSAICYLLFFFH